MHKTKIDWCDFTWNPVWGCLNSCPYCYARATANRWGISFEPHWRERNFNRAMPKVPSRIFVNSMSEIAYWQPEWWTRVIERIQENPQHKFLFLTKKPEVYFDRLFPENCWLGLTVTGPADFDQYQDAMRYLPNLRFLSYEPMLAQVDPDMVDESIDWVILAAESGNRAGKVMPLQEWIVPWLDLKIPLYMKHNLPWSGPWRKEFPA
jgi:protein gp37